MRPAPDTKTDEPCFTAGTVRFLLERGFMFPIKLLFLDMRLCAFRVPVSVAVAVLFGTILNSGLERNDGCTGCGYGRLRRGTLKTVPGMSVYRNMSWLFYGAAEVKVFPGHGPEFVERRGESNGGGRTIDNGKTGAGLRCRSLDVGDRLGDGLKTNRTRTDFCPWVVWRWCGRRAEWRMRTSYRDGGCIVFRNGWKYSDRCGEEVGQSVLSFFEKFRYR